MAPTKSTKKGTSKSTAQAVSPKKETVTKKNKRTHPFPFKMRDVLKGNNKHIIDWMEGGKVFIIKDHRAFETDILPQYGFETRELRFFSRNLSAWGFNRANRDPKIYVGCPGGTMWKNKHFYKGATDDVLKLIKRKPQMSKRKTPKSTCSLSCSSADDEMDLDDNKESIEQPVDSTEEEEEEEEQEDDNDDDDVPLETTLQREDSLFARNSEDLFAIHQSGDELPVEEAQVKQPTRPTPPSFMRRHLENLWTTTTTPRMK